MTWIRALIAYLRELRDYLADDSRDDPGAKE